MQRDLRYRVLLRNSAGVRREVRVTLAVAQPQPAPDAIAVRVFAPHETKAVTLKNTGPLAFGQPLKLTVTVRANGATLRRSYRVRFTLRD